MWGSRSSDARRVCKLVALEWTFEVRSGTLRAPHRAGTASGLGFCHESAAVAFGLSVSYSSLDVVHVATSRSRRNVSSKSVRWHVISGDEPVVVRGLRVTSLSRTVFDCMRTSGFEQALAVADSALRVSGKPSSWFVSCFKRLGSGHSRVADAVRTMYHADPLSESGGESIARAVMIRQGFALPEL